MLADRATKLFLHLGQFAAPLACAAGLCAQPAPAASTTTLYTQFQHSPPSAVIEALRAESETIMGRLGISLEWRSLAAARGNEVSSRLAVIRFQGRCDVAGLSPHRAQPGALGWTHASNGVILPFGDVDCDRIRSFIQPDLLAVPAGDREFVFGRAVGRVLAHELYHILARSPHHASGGVGKAEYAVYDLLAAHFVFDAPASEELRGNQLRASATEFAH